MSENACAWIALNLLPTAPRNRRRLAEACGGPAGVFRAGRQHLRGIAGIRPEIADKIVDRDWMSSAEKEIDKANKQNVHILTPESSIYPAGLKDLDDPPAALYVRGELRPADALSVAVIGARNASDYGLSTAKELAFQLARRGLTVVSGLALGADAAAHRGALEGGGRTLAVLGCGVDVTYPRRHWKLLQKVVEGGAAISELPLGSPASPWSFPQRNRLIAALTLGTVVVEAADRSGSLITVDFAAELGRQVCAVPGRITAKRSRGTNALIHDGACLVRDAQDVIDALPATWRRQVRPATAPVDAEALGLQEAEARVLSGVGSDEPVHVDALARSSGLALGPLLDALLSLEVRRLVRSVPGGRYIRAADLRGGERQAPLFSKN